MALSQLLVAYDYYLARQQVVQPPTSEPQALVQQRLVVASANIAEHGWSKRHW